MIKKLLFVIIGFMFFSLGNYLFFTGHISSEKKILKSCDNLEKKELNVFFQKIENLSEKNRKKKLEDRNLISGYTWKDYDLSRYQIIAGHEEEPIYSNSNPYICAAVDIISSPNYDQSQKMYTIMLMHYASIEQHIFLLKAANKAYEQKILTDKEVLAELLYSPELQGKSTNSKYTWLPAWRREFKKHANEVLSEEEQEEVLSGKTLLWGL